MKAPEPDNSAFDPDKAVLWEKQPLSTSRLRLRLNEADTIFERFDKEIIVVQLATGAYHSITGTGVDAFLLLPFEPTADEIAEVLSQKYAASTENILQDLGPFLEFLREQSIILTYPPNGNLASRPTLPHSGPRLSYTPPAIELFRDLAELFLSDPVHEVGLSLEPLSRSETESIQAVTYHPTPSRSMLFERFDDETVAMNLSTGAYYSLTGPAEDIFLLLGEEPSTAEIVRAIATKYVASEEHLHDATARFLDSLVSAGLAEERALETSPEAPRPIRKLDLAKPGLGHVFQSPTLDGFHDHGGGATLLDDDQKRSSWLKYGRRRFSIQGSQVLVRLAGSDAVVIGLEKGNYYLLNQSAATVFRLLEQKPTSTELVNALDRLYDVGRRELNAAVLILLYNLVGENLVEVEPAHEGSRQLAIDGCEPRKPFAPFSVEVFRDLRHLFLPFPGTNSDRPETPTNGIELVRLLAGYHEEVSKRAGLTQAVFNIAGKNVRIRCAGSIAASELGLAFGHLHSELPSADDLTIQVWDFVSGGPPSHPFLSSYLRDLHEHWDTLCGCRGEVRAVHTPELPVLYHAGPDILSVVDTENRTAYFLKRNESPLPYWEFGSPFRTILHFWLSTLGLQFVHGGAVGSAEGGVLLVGKGGAGKSTSTLACLNAGMAYAGDDYCAVELDPSPYLHSVYSSAKLKGKKDLERFPDLVDYLWNPDCFANNNGDKATFFLSRRSPDRMSAGFPLRAILVPKITGERDTRIGECSEAQALLAISASTIAQLPMAGSPDLERLGNLVARLPRYTLYLGTDLSQIPNVVRSVL